MTRNEGLPFLARKKKASIACIIRPVSIHTQTYNLALQFRYLFFALFTYVTELVFDIIEHILFERIMGSYASYSMQDILLIQIVVAKFMSFSTHSQ